MPMLRPSLPLLAAVAAGCDPYAAWPDPTDVFPWGVPPEQGLPDYALVRVETETWTPLVDLTETALYVQKATLHKPSAPRDEVLHFGLMRPSMPALAPSDTRLSFVGDVMRFHGNWTGFADGVAELVDGDVRVGNLETPTSASFPTDADDLAAQFGIYAFNSPPALIDGLPLDLVQVNNNHTLDLGDPGIDDTVAAVTATGRVPIGVDTNLAYAEVDGATIAFLSYTWGLNASFPTVHDLHVVPFGHLGGADGDGDIDLSPIATDVAGARDDGADLVVLLLHWGYEYEYYPDPHFLRLGRALVGLGADLVVGSGPHAVEPAELCDVNRPLAVPEIGRCSIRTDDGRPRTAAILYSLGDFGTELATVPLQVGVIGTVSLAAGFGVTGLGWQAVASVPEAGGGQSLVPLDDLAAAEAAAEAGATTASTDAGPYTAESARLNQLLGASWRR